MAPVLHNYAWRNRPWAGADTNLHRARDRSHWVKSAKTHTDLSKKHRATLNSAYRETDYLNLIRPLARFGCSTLKTPNGESFPPSRNK